MKAKQGGTLLKSTARRDGVMNMQLSIAALEVAAPNARLSARGSMSESSFSHQVLRTTKHTRPRFRPDRHVQPQCALRRAVNSHTAMRIGRLAYAAGHESGRLVLPGKALPRKAR
jgi:hypothetical protein